MLKIEIKPEHVRRQHRQHRDESVEQNLGGPTEEPLWDLANQISQLAWHSEYRGFGFSHFGNLLSSEIVLRMLFDPALKLCSRN